MTDVYVGCLTCSYVIGDVSFTSCSTRCVSESEGSCDTFASKVANELARTITATLGKSLAIESKQRLHQVNHHVRVCVERCLRTKRHKATCSGDSSGRVESAQTRPLESGYDSKAAAGCTQVGRSGPRSTITASLWPSPRADHKWHSSSLT